MMCVSIRNNTRDRIVGDRIRVADRTWTRLRGLLGSPEPGEGEGLVIVPSRAVHMFGMRFPLDVIFLDREGQAVAVYPGLAPGQKTRYHRDARLAIEVGIGTIERTQTRLGDRFEWIANGEVRS